MKRSRVLRYCAAAVCVDCGFYLALTGVPYKAIHLGATPLVIGLLPTVWSVVYIAAAGIMGRLSDRVPRITLARLGTVVIFAALLIMALSPGVAGLFAGMPLAAVGLAMFWPALQAAVADADDAGRLGGNLGLFNVSWSVGKGSGFLFGGAILEHMGFNALFSTSMILIVSVALFLRGAPRSLETDAAVPVPELETGEERLRAAGRRRVFLFMAWIANGTAFGVAATLNYHYPGFLDPLNLGSSLFGGFLGLIYFSQTATFLVLMRTNAWHYRLRPLLSLCVVLAASMFLLTALDRPGLILTLAPVIGAAMGLAYYSSIYYSLHAAASRGRNTGLHEAIIGSGALLLPLLGGGAATWLGRLDLPFLLTGGVCLAAVTVQAVLARKAGFRLTSD